MNNLKEPLRITKIKRKFSDLTKMSTTTTMLDFKIMESMETFSRIYDAIRILYQDGEYEILNTNSLLCVFPQFSDKKLYIFVNEKNQLYVNWEETKNYTLMDSNTNGNLLSTRKKVQCCIDIVRKIQWKHFCLSLVDTMNQTYIKHKISYMFMNQSEYFCYLFIANVNNLKSCLLCIKIEKNYQLWDIPLPSEPESDLKSVFISDNMKKAYTTFYYELAEYLHSKNIIAEIDEDGENKNANE